jgi:hypothetical protein
MKRKDYRVKNLRNCSFKLRIPFVFVNDGSKDNTLGYYKNYVKGMKIESVFITVKRMVEKLKRLGWECCIWQKIVNITI